MMLQDVHCSTDQLKMIQPAGRRSERFFVYIFGWRKEEKMKLNSAVFCSDVVCDAGWIICGDWEKRNRELGLRLMV